MNVTIIITEVKPGIVKTVVSFVVVSSVNLASLVMMVWRISGKGATGVIIG